VHAKSSDIGTGLAADPEYTEMSVIVELVELVLMDGSDTQLSLDGGDKRRSLEQSTRQCFQCPSKLRFTAW
jgi:hypothetical protein